MTDSDSRASSDIDGGLRVVAKPWPAILQFYESLEKDAGWDSHPMTELVRAIAGSRLGTGLYAITSHAVLVIGQTERFSFSDGALRIEFDSTSQTFHFEYRAFGRDVSARPLLATPPPGGPGSKWERDCSASEGMPVLEQFLFDKMKWFVR